jgi:hypothetical protein
MRWRRNGSVGWLSNVKWVCVSLVVGLSLTVRTAPCAEPSSVKSSVVVMPDSSAVTISLSEYLLLLDDIAYLEADLSECRSRLDMAIETPPECSSEGVPWWAVVVSALAGAVAYSQLD